MCYFLDIAIVFFVQSFCLYHKLSNVRRFCSIDLYLALYFLLGWQAELRICNRFCSIGLYLICISLYFGYIFFSYGMMAADNSYRS